ncbi:transmembrane protein 87A-like [Diadema antillarum]|uniref:transmembrane protein 87A-like n=1 Tax=Diadema antillarum TaxID=105358 RepID=UPI003A884CC0
MGQFERYSAVLAVFCMVLPFTRGAFYLEPGIFELEMAVPVVTPEGKRSNQSLEAVQKSVFRESEVAINVIDVSGNCAESCQFTIEWTIRQSYCDGIYRTLFGATNNFTTELNLLRTLYTFPQCRQMDSELHVAYMKSVVSPNVPIKYTDEGPIVFQGLHDLSDTDWQCVDSDPNSQHCNKEECPLKQDKPPEQNAGEGAAPKPDGNQGGGAEGGEDPNPAQVEESGKKGGDEDQGGDGGKDQGGEAAGDSGNGDTGASDQVKDAASGGGAKTQGEPGGTNPETKARRKRAESSPNQPKANTENKPSQEEVNESQENSPEETKPPAATKAPPKKLSNRVLHTNEQDGRILFLVSLTSSTNVKVKMEVTMKSPWGYLSATQYPLLPFYGVMCGIYSIMALVWMVLLFRQWKDLLRIQFCISAVIILGLIEKAAFVAEFERHNNTGRSTNTGIFIAEEISVLKRTLARMLVIVVSLGYGITRPRLGRDFNWVMGAGVLFFILSSIEAIFRISGSNYNSTIALLPLSVLDALLCWWIFRSLVDTSRTLRLRRNVVKLWLYRHFTNALIFCVVAALIFLIWSVKMHRMNNCVHKWNELWLDDAYWHILFCVILFVIMILLRPTANNQRYAYSVLSDAVDDDDSKEPMMNDAFESVKMRNVPSSKSSSSHANKEQDDLQWVEDNIPAAVADAALAAFDDSEEELITNMERNKME